MKQCIANHKINGSIKDKAIKMMKPWYKTNKK